jgi:uncharacterized phage protein gp47/JayE
MEEITAIYQRMRETFARRAGFEPSENCDAMVRLYALSAQLQALLTQADWVLEQSFPQTAKGAYLDYHAQTRALERRKATYAAGTLRFFAGANAPADYEIPVNTVCMNEAGRRFATISPAVLRAGEPYVDVPARAMEPGEAGNAIAGAVTVISALPTGIVACTNPEAFSGGNDAETDEALRERILESYRRMPNGANAAFYEQTAMSFDEVAAAKAVGRARGIGTVDVYIAAQGGAPTQELCQRVAAVLEEKREIAVDVRVLAPTMREVDVAAEITVKPGYVFSEVCEHAEAVLRAQFTGMALGKNVLTAHLSALIFGVEGVANCHLLTPSDDVAIGPTELPVLHTLTWSEIED